MHHLAYDSVPQSQFNDQDVKPDSVERGEIVGDCYINHCSEKKKKKKWAVLSVMFVRSISFKRPRACIKVAGCIGPVPHRFSTVFLIIAGSKALNGTKMNLEMQDIRTSVFPNYVIYRKLCSPMRRSTDSHRGQVSVELCYWQTKLWVELQSSQPQNGSKYLIGSLIMKAPPLPARGGEQWAHLQTIHIHLDTTDWLN